MEPVRREILEDIPKEKLDSIIKDFESEGAKIEVVAQDNGKFTVIAYFPEQLPSAKY